MLMKINRFKSAILAVIVIAVILISLFACQRPKQNKNKALLIGLDGASWNVMQPLLEGGKLPNIKLLMDKGCWGGNENF